MRCKIPYTYMFLLLQDGELLHTTSAYTVQSSISTLLISNNLYSCTLNYGFNDCHFIYVDWVWYCSNLIL